MKCSVVMPVLNSQAYLKAAINSIISQTYDDWELILVDGGSTDGSLDIMETYAKKENRIRLIPQQQMGIYSALFEGFDVATGQIFSWLNSDDLYSPWSLATVVQAMQTSPETRWLMGLPGAWDKNGLLRYTLPMGIMPRSWIRKGYFHPNFLGCIQAESTFFLADMWKGLSDQQRDEICALSLAGDYLIWRKFAERASLTVLPTLLGGFRNHGENRSMQQFETYMKEVHESGGAKISPRLGRRLGQLFALCSASRFVKAAQKVNHQLNQENNNRL